MIKIFSFGGKKIVEAWVPNREKWVPELLEELEANRDALKHSHKIGGRWENSYLPVDLVPCVREPMRFARDLGKETWNKIRDFVRASLPFTSSFSSLLV